ncbi:MAG: hypothetical protein IT454_09630 [Planctomycetes bacterium]|nr:hypothetical protein [Planctomycetota bacterium]
MNCKWIAPVVALALCTSCVGMRQAEGQFTVHAESFRIVGFAIPGDDQAAAAKMVKDQFPNATQVSSHSTSADWTSFWGVLGNIIGLHQTTISGKTGS